MSLDSRLFESQVWNGQSRVEVFLRGHLWIEHFLATLLAVQFKRPEAVALDRLTWMHKLNLCDGFGLLRDWEIAALTEVNRMRNRLAHDLSGEPTAKDIAKLLALSPPSVLEAVEAVRKVELNGGRLENNGDESLADLRFWLLVVAMDLDYRVEVGEYRKEHETKLYQAAAVVAAHELTGRSITREEAEQAQGLPPWPKPGDSFRSRPESKDT